MDYIFFLANASLTLRVIEFLNFANHLSLESITVLYRSDGWLIKVKTFSPLTSQQDADFQSFIKELGILYQPDSLLKKVFLSLEKGQSIIEVMRLYKVAIVSHGLPNKKDIEAFREGFTQGLGYFPPTLA